MPPTPSIAWPVPPPKSLYCPAPGAPWPYQLDQPEATLAIDGVLGGDGIDGTNLACGPNWVVKCSGEPAAINLTTGPQNLGFELVVFQEKSNNSAHGSNVPAHDCAHINSQLQCCRPLDDADSDR